MDQGFRILRIVRFFTIITTHNCLFLTPNTTQILPRSHLRDLRLLLRRGRHRRLHRDRLVPLRHLHAPDLIALHPLVRARLRDPQHRLDRQEPLGILRPGQGRPRVGRGEGTTYWWKLRS